MNYYNNSSPLLIKFRKVILVRGPSGIKKISRLWKGPDENGKRLLTLAEFQQMILYHNILIDENEASQLFQEFDTNRIGMMDYDYFLTTLTFIPDIYKTTIENMIHIYNVKSNPKFINGEMSEKQCLELFLDSFGIDQHQDGIITCNDFFQYYAGVSQSIESDIFFDILLRNSWRL